MHSELSFILAGGPVSIAVAVILLLMSLLSWFVMLERSISLLRERQASKHFTQAYANCTTLAQVLNIEASGAMVGMVKKAILAAEHSEKQNWDEDHQADFIAKIINRTIADHSQNEQRGLSVLASVGSIAPFVGLFGTVWGIYHALESISLSGQATLDKVAGPVGEALIMTAIGLAVAIPAVLAYNAFLKANQNSTHALQRMGEEIHTLICSGSSLNISQDNSFAQSTKLHQQRPSA